MWRFPLELLTAQDIGQAAHKEDHHESEEEKIEHLELLLTNMVLNTVS